MTDTDQMEKDEKRVSWETGIQPREEKILLAIQGSKEALYRSEKEKTLTQLEFLYGQMRYMKKYWWLLQAAVLAALWWIMYTAGNSFYVQKSMGVMAPLFAVLLLPELWKNRTSGAVEIEGAAYYSLRQIYAARMMLFALADILLISTFFLASSFTLRITAWEMSVHFLLPFSITCCICFGTLCSRRWGSEYLAVGLCLLWTVIWVRIILDEGLYKKLSAPVLLCTILLSALYVCYSVYRTLKNCENCWEVNAGWN